MKHVKDLYTKKYKILLKEIEKDTKKLKDIFCSWIRRINVIKMILLTKAVCRSNVICIKIQKTMNNVEINKAKNMTN